MLNELMKLRTNALKKVKRLSFPQFLSGNPAGIHEILKQVQNDVLDAR